MLHTCYPSYLLLLKSSVCILVFKVIYGHVLLFLLPEQIQLIHSPCIFFSHYRVQFLPYQCLNYSKHHRLYCQQSDVSIIHYCLLIFYQWHDSRLIDISILFTQLKTFRVYGFPQYPTKLLATVQIIGKTIESYGLISSYDFHCTIHFFL